MAAVLDVDVITDPTSAAAVLDPLKGRILRLLAEPGSASTVAAALGETRQKVNYHVRAMEQLGLVHFVEDRARRGLTERIVVATAASFVIDPSALGENAVNPDRIDRLSARYLVAVAGRMITELGALGRRADGTGRTLATLTIDTEVRFATAEDRASFTAELANAITGLVARYHDERALDGRRHRVVVAAHPHPGTNREGTTP